MKKKQTVIIIIIILIIAGGIAGVSLLNSKPVKVLTQNSTLSGAGKVSILAGTGEQGSKDGKATEAQFSFPDGIAEGKNGVVYVADSKNHLIRVISPDGSVATLTGLSKEKDKYGMPSGGFADGDVKTAMFNQPKGLAIDADDNLYVADAGNGAVRVVDKTGTVKTLTKGLNYPSDVVIGNKGELFVSDTLNHRIVKVDKNGTITLLAGGGYENKNGWLVGGFADGKGEAAKFNEPSGLAIGSDGTLFVADSGNQRIRSISPDGNVLTIAGSGSDQIAGTSYVNGGYKDGAASVASFNFPTGLAVSADGTIYVADTYNHLIRSISKDGQVKTFAGTGEHGIENGSPEKAIFNGPGYVRISSGRMLISDRFGNLVRQLN